MDAVNTRLTAIEQDDRALVVLNGDIMNTAVRTGVSDIYGEVAPPMSQIETATRLLEPIKHKIIGGDTGNHENRVYKNDGIDMMRLIMRQLGIEDRYSPEGILMIVRLGWSHRNHRPICYTLYATHGSGGGRKEGAKAIRLADMAAIVDADCYIHSHTHLPMVMKEKFFRVDTRSGTVSPVTKLFVNDASSLQYGGYGQTQEYKPMSTSSPVIFLNGARRELKATL